ncbi:MAG: hypothetical protein ACE5IO_05640 [Thermoplasmata archaeon]
MKEPYEDTQALLSEENRASATFEIRKEKKNRHRIELSTNESAYIILGTSYDEGWRLHTRNSARPISLLDYKGLSMFFIEEPGSYDITMEFITYEESLGMIVIYSVGAVLLASVFLAYPRLVPWIKKSYHRFGVFIRKRREESKKSRK